MVKTIAKETFFTLITTILALCKNKKKQLTVLFVPYIMLLYTEMSNN